jgi:hypothetical protein
MKFDFVEIHCEGKECNSCVVWFGVCVCVLKSFFYFFAILFAYVFALLLNETKISGTKYCSIDYHSYIFVCVCVLVYIQIHCCANMYLDLRKYGMLCTNGEKKEEEIESI